MDVLPFDTPKLVRNLSQQHWDCAIDDLRNATASSKKELEGDEPTVTAGSSRCYSCPVCPRQPSLEPCWHFLVRNNGESFTCETWNHGKLCAEETYNWKEPRKIVAIKVF